MNTWMIASITALFIAGQIFSPVAAASGIQSATATSCGDTYTVQAGDFLNRIARDCDITIADILTLNPQVTNANIIYAGQVLRLSGDAPAVTTTIYYPYNTSTVSYSGSARVRISTSRAVAGDEVTVAVSGFPAYADLDFRLGLSGDTYSVVYDGKTDAYGAATQVITLPAEASTGDTWLVRVLTTGEVKVTDVTSQPIYIGTYTTITTTTYSSTARVILSSTSSTAGSTLTVTVAGFPAGAEIDYRLGIDGETYSVAYDGTIASDGSSSQTITIPSSATSGQYWIVQVVTTSLKNVTSVYSHTIHITS